MAEVFPIFIRVATSGSEPSGKLNVAASALGLLGTRIEICVVLGRWLATATGTTAPFSAISGAVRTTLSLSAAPVPPYALITSSTEWRSEERSVGNKGGRTCK